MTTTHHKIPTTPSRYNDKEVVYFRSSCVDPLREAINNPANDSSMRSYGTG